MHGNVAHSMDSDTQTDFCAGCSSDCCKTQRCAAHACGAGVLGMVVSYETPLSNNSQAVFASPQKMALTECVTSLFRPPQV